MSAERLRAMLSEATPGPWKVNDEWSDYSGDEAGPEGVGWVDPHGAYSNKRADNVLIALAPDAIALLADMADHLGWLSDGASHELLLRLDALTRSEGVTDAVATPKSGGGR